MVSDHASGGSVTYRVAVDSDSCWTGRRIAEAVTENKHLPADASGCVH